MTFLLINKNGASFIDIPNTLEAINETLDWDDAWNTPTITIEGNAYIVICSDLGKVKHEPVSAMGINNLLCPSDDLKEPFIVGNILVTKFNGVDDFDSLNAKDIDILTDKLWNHGINQPNMFNPTLLIID